jgi:dolichyl-phosphate beta-glucosyltransferase
MNPYLSIIIPAFNESERIGLTLASIDRYMGKQPYSYEVLVVDDGSTDHTITIVTEAALTMKNLRVTKLSTNKGKGAAVKAGMEASIGQYRLFMDADGSTSIEEVSKLLPHLEHGYDVVIGSRRAQGAVIQVKQNLLRDFLGWGFRGLVHVMVPIGITDTQNGFKLFSQRAAETIFPKLKTKSWSFDVEVLIIAQKQGYKVKEVPIVWVNDGRSKMRAYHILQMLKDLWYIRSST